LTELHRANLNVYLTTTTTTGFQIARKNYATLTGQVAYFPLDFWLFSWLAWRRIRPKLILLMEGELWPEHLHAARRRGVKTLLINGRCSDRSFNRYQKCPGLARYLLNHVDCILAAEDIDRERFCGLGFPSGRVYTLGNLKIDAATRQTCDAPAPGLLRSHLGPTWSSALILLGASTWPGEEKCLIEAYLEGRKRVPELKLILVPRHVERTREVVALIKNYPVSCRLRSLCQEANDTDLYLVNTTGELKQFIALADFVFVGKSLAPNRGGQTPLEAAAAGKPMVYGPHMQNFSAICQSLELAQGAVRCASAAEVRATLLRWVERPQSARAQGERARSWTLNNRGATLRTLPYILSRLDHPPA
jgi:3-deoxy-D-manno-octulosonic-acid transferase